MPDTGKGTQHPRAKKVMNPTREPYTNSSLPMFIPISHYILKTLLHIHRKLSLLTKETSTANRCTWLQNCTTTQNSENNWVWSAPVDKSVTQLLLLSLREPDGKNERAGPGNMRWGLAHNTQTVRLPKEDLNNDHTNRHVNVQGEFSDPTLKQRATVWVS